MQALRKAKVMRVSLDLETACTVEGCPDYGKSLCKNDHSLSPWHSRVTVISIADDSGNNRVFSSSTSVSEARDYCSVRYSLFDGHNFKFDYLFLAVHGWTIPLDQWVGDSSIAAYVLSEKIPDDWLEWYDEVRKTKGSHHRKAGKHSLKSLAPYFLKVKPFWETENHADLEYAQKDAVYTRQLVELLENKLKDLNQFDFYQTLLKWTKMLMMAEFRGIQYDKAAASIMQDKIYEVASKQFEDLKNRWKQWEDLKFKQDLQKVIEEYNSRGYTEKRRNQLLPKALAKVHPGINYSSPAQITWILRDCMNLDITGWDDEESTGAAVLTKLAETNEDIRVFKDWRKNNKLLTSFFPTLEAYVVSGAVHPIYNVDVTRTGRTSSQRPNAQQIPATLKPLFKARPGYKIVGYDAAAIEAKLIAYYTEDPVLYSIIKDGVSIHDFNTKKWFKLDCEVEDVKEKHNKERKATKNVGFALFYNAGYNRIRIALAQAGFSITDERAREIHRQFKQDFKVAHTEANKVVRRFERGDVVLSLLGRPLIIENPQDCYMKGFNKLIQSSASDYLLHTAHNAMTTMQALKIDAHPVLFVHDYVGFEVEESQAEQASRIIYAAMTSVRLETKLGPIKLDADGGISDVWE
jgi:DNA polymerase I-like protein with 3'-5' exonuclease and polymerase domains